MKLTFIVFWIAFLGFNTTSIAQPQPLDLVSQAIGAIQDNFYDTAYGKVSDWERLKFEIFKQTDESNDAYQGINNLLDSIDDTSLRFLKKQQFNTFFKELITGEHIGLGLPELLSVDIDSETGDLIIIAPLYGSPAFNAGLRPRDKILTVNGQSTRGITIQEAMKLLRVAENKKVKLRIERNDRELTIKVKSKKVEPFQFPFYQTVEYKKQKTGIIWLQQFSQGTGLRISEIVKNMETEGVASIILDLRHNPGGLIKEAQIVAGLFLGEKPMAFTSSKNSAIKMLASTSAKQFDLPLTVLVDEGTASSAEALAGVLQYYKRAKIIGTKTHGKGLIYDFYGLEDDSVLVMPVGRLRMLDHRDVLTKGIKPDQIFKTKKTFKLHKSYKKDPLLKFVVKATYNN